MEQILTALTSTLPAFVFVLGLVIFVHEAGHLVTAKAFGMRVFIFSFGFGKRLFGFKWGDTDCRVSLIPLGGYVKLEGEPEDHLSEDTSTRAVGDGRDFLSRPRWQRFLVYLAGPIMNAVLTLSVLTVFYMIGFAVEASRYGPAVLGAVDEGSPAAAAGLRPGDTLVAVDGEAVANWEELVYQIHPRPDREVAIRFRRGAEERTATVRTRAAGRERAGEIGVHPLVQVASVVAGSPAAAAGVQPDDGILRIGDKPVTSFDDVPPLVQASTAETLALDIWRAGTIQHLEVRPDRSSGTPRIGIGGPKTLVMKFPLPGAVQQAANWSWNMTKQTLGLLRGIGTGRVSPRSALMGPVEIARVSGERAREGGIAALVLLSAILSLSVGILNLLPIAPLDGGHMAILLGESVVRRDFSMNVKSWIMNAGALVIFLLIGFVLYSDLSKIEALKKLLP
jgi:regulator of sigma E protease